MASGVPENLGFPFNIVPVVEISDFKFGMRLGFTTVSHEIKEKGKSVPGPKVPPQNLGSSLVYLQWLKIATSNLICNFTKSETAEEVTVALGQESSKISELPLLYVRNSWSCNGFYNGNIILNRKTANINVKTQLTDECYRPITHWNQKKVITVNLFAEHVDIVTMWSALQKIHHSYFFAVFDVWLRL